MKVLVTGSAGHLGEALVRTLKNTPHEVIGTDLIHSDFTNRVGSITGRAHVKQCMEGIDAVLHAATLHKPHVATHSQQDFVDTTSTFGDALTPSVGAPAAWITEDVVPVPKNIYGVTKVAAENICELFYRNHRLPCLILRTSRFFPEEDDRKEVRQAYEDRNIKVNEFLYRRVDIEDVVRAHLLAIEKAPAIGFARYIISATTPFARADLLDLRVQAPAVVKRRVPDYEAEYARRGWRMFPGIDRVYVNERARNELDWYPRYNFSNIVDSLKANDDPRSPLSRIIGSKGYHPYEFAEGPYPVE
jgi:UDP-glucose 4-epimerase